MQDKPRTPVSGAVQRILTDRFLVRTLGPKDATERYLGWFSDFTVIRFIQAAKKNQSIDTLRAFITQKLASHDAELFGIFVRQSFLHIGNIKFEPIDEKEETAIVGVLIGDPAWRGKGVFREVFPRLSVSLRQRRNIRHFWLGVERANEAALAGYQKSGFIPGVPPPTLVSARREDCIYMHHKVK